MRGGVQVKGDSYSIKPEMMGRSCEGREGGWWGEK